MKSETLLPFIIIGAGGVVFLVFRALSAREEWLEDEKKRSYWQHLKFELRGCGVLLREAMFHPFRKSSFKVDNDQMKVWIEVEKNGGTAVH